MEARRCRRRTASAAAATRRRLRSLLALAGDYLKYLLMKRGRLLGRVARRSLAALVLSSGGGKRCLATTAGAEPPWPPCAVAEHEFSCSNSPSPAFLAARRLRSRLKSRAGAASSSCFGALRSPCGSPAPPAAATEAADQEEEEEEDEVDQYGAWACGGGEIDVDYRAEEFINMFYEQLRAQSFQPPAVFQCGSP
uniref:Uncharacterized protein n=1 Tax=Oryza punctata TaxID=4537 RepID=A0A0E0K0G5_ORYPU